MANQLLIKYTVVLIFTLVIIISSFPVLADEPENIDTCEFQEQIMVILPQDSTYVTYLDQDILTRPDSPAITPLLIDAKPLNPGFCVVVNSTIYPAIKNSLDQYSKDVNASGYNTKIVTGTWPTIEQVRAILKGEWQNNGTVAAVLIGNFSIPWYIHGGEIFPIDLYFMDLDGVWVDSNSDDVFDDHTGNVAPDIVFGRLPAHMLSADEAQLLNNYFNKNHLYRTGQLKLPNKNLVYVDDDWYGSAEGWKSDAELNYDNVTMEKNGATTCAQDYKQRLVQDYEFVQVHCHANHLPTRHNFKVGGNFEPQDVNSTDIKNLDPHTFFSILFTCGSAKYSAEDFLAAWYTFTDTYGLASISSSKVGGMLNYDDFYQPLSENKTIGEAFYDWFFTNAESSRSWFYGMTLIGDPLLRTNQFDLECDDITFSNPAPYQDDTVYVETTVINQLDNCSGVDVRLYDGDPGAGGTVIDTLEADFGWNEPVTLNFSWLATAGVHEFWVVADYNDEVFEINETNNIGHRALSVYELPDVELCHNPTVVYTYDDINFSGLTQGGFGAIEGYYFDFGDGNNSGWLSENYTLFNYTDNGAYNAYLQVVDSNGHYAASDDSIITVLNRAPVAVLETDLPVDIYEVQTNDTIQFNGTKSYDPDGTIASYYWDFGDDITMFGAAVEHTYEENGIYIVKLYILDDDGGSGETYLTITVNNRLPVAVAQVDNNITQTNTIITFSGAQSYDPDGEIVSYYWEFGDGATSSYKSPGYKYDDNGNYTVTLKVMDDDGDMGLVTIEIIVLNRLPTVEISASAIEVHTYEKIYFNATVGDTDGVVVATRWEFGDNNTSSNISAVHEFDDDGVYIVNFTAIDDDGAWVFAIIEITVRNKAPGAEFFITPGEGNTSTLFAFNSSSYDTDGVIANITWEFGDGNLSYAPKVTHQYAEPGNYTVILRIRDDDGELTEIVTYLKIEKVPDPVLPEPEEKVEDNNNKTNHRDQEESGLVNAIMIMAIIVVVVVIILIVVFFVLLRKKRGEGGAPGPGGAIGPLDEEPIHPQLSEPQTGEAPHEPPSEIEWDDDEDDEDYMNY